MNNTNNGAGGRTLLQKIKSNYFAVRVTLFAVLFLAPNIFFVFWTISPEYQLPFLREFFAAGVALLLSSYIMYYTIKKDDEAANWFYSFEVFIALCNYWIRLMFNENGKFEWNWFILPATAFAFMLPWAVKRSAQSIDDEVDETSVDNLQKNNAMLTKRNEELIFNAGDLSNKNLELIEQIQNYHTGIGELKTAVKSEKDRADYFKNQVDVMKQFILPATATPIREKVPAPEGMPIYIEPEKLKEFVKDLPSPDAERNGAELSTAVDQVPDLKEEATNKERVSTWKDEEDIFKSGAVNFKNVQP